MSSSCYVYAIQARGTPLPPAVLGFENQPLFVVPHVELEAVSSELGHGTIEPSGENVFHHEVVVEAVRQTGPAVPVRFGTILPGRDAIVKALGSRYSVLLDDLKRLGDKVELGLSVLWDQAESNGGEDEHPGGRNTDGPGTRYLRARFSQYRHDAELRQRAGEVARELERRLGPHALDHRLRILPTHRLPVRVAYLVHPSSVDDFQHAFVELRQERSDLRLLLSGPWPPYSFVTTSEARGDTATDEPAQDIGRAPGIPV